MIVFLAVLSDYNVKGGGPKPYVAVSQQQTAPQLQQQQQQEQQQQQQQQRNKMAALGKAALGGAFAATAVGEAYGAVQQNGGNQAEPTVGEQFVGDVAEAATGAALDAAMSGEVNVEELGKFEQLWYFIKLVFLCLKINTFLNHHRCRFGWGWSGGSSRSSHEGQQEGQEVWEDVWPVKHLKMHRKIFFHE